MDGLDRGTVRYSTDSACKPPLALEFDSGGHGLLASSTA